MRLALLLALLASSAAAQTPDTTAARRPTAGVVLGGAAAGISAVLVGTLVLKAVGADEGGAILFYPVGAAAGVTEIGRSQGRHGTFRGAALGAARGTLFAAGGALLLGYGLGSIFKESDDNSAAILVGLAVVFLAPPYAAAAGYNASEVRPAVLVGPDGARAAGLSLRVAL